jgi:uncharacterized protein HemY
MIKFVLWLIIFSGTILGLKLIDNHIMISILSNDYQIKISVFIIFFCAIIVYSMIFVIFQTITSIIKFPLNIKSYWLERKKSASMSDLINSCAALATGDYSNWRL